MSPNQKSQNKVRLALIEYYLNCLSRQFAIGKHRSRFLGRGYDYQGLVPYPDFPDFPLIDWRAFLNTGELMTRVFSEERRAEVDVLANLGPSMGFGSDETKIWRLALISASLSFSAIRFKDTFRFFGYTDEVELGFPEPRANKDYPFQLAEAILSFDWRGKERGGLARVVHKLPRQRSLVIIISDFYGNVDRVAEILEPVVVRHDVIPIVLWDKREIELPPSPFESFPRPFRWIPWPLPLRDLETGELRYVFLTRKTREAHRRNIEKQRSRIQTLFRRFRIEPFFFTEEESDLEALIKLFLQRREQFR